MGVEYELYFNRETRLSMFLLLKISKTLHSWNTFHIQSQYIEYPLLIKHVDYLRLLLITCNMDEDVFQDHRTITTSDVFYFLVIFSVLIFVNSRVCKSYILLFFPALDSCVGKSCYNEGFCDSSYSPSQCLCRSGFSGENCSIGYNSKTTMKFR